MSRDPLKRAAAEVALALVPQGGFIGVGTGSTTDFFIAGLGDVRDRIEGVVASSERSAAGLRGVGVPVVDLAEIDGKLPLYVDGADEATERRELIKGGGGALTREKIIAEASRQFVCILDESKLVERLGAFPLPVEVIPMAWKQVAETLAGLGGRAVKREGFVTDNGNWILDVHALVIEHPSTLEEELDRIPGVVGNGLFCRRRADLLVVGGRGGVRRIGSAAL